MDDVMDRVNQLLAKEYENVPATQVVKEVDWQNMNEGMACLGFHLCSIEEFCRADKADVVRAYHEGKLLLFRSAD